MPLGAALGGIIGERYGVTTVFWTSAALSAICIPLLLSALGEIERLDSQSADEPQPASA